MAKFIKEDETRALDKAKHELDVSRATWRTLAFEKKALEGNEFYASLESLEKKNEYVYKLEQLRDELMEEIKKITKKGEDGQSKDGDYKSKN